MIDDTARKLTIRELVAGEDTYRVPEYQRNYAWTATEITQLISDVRLAHAAEQSPFGGEDSAHRGAPAGGASPYFLGNIITTRAAHAALDVVDGQQRLTTLMLLIAYLRISLKTTPGAPDVPAKPLTFASRGMATDAIARLTAATTHDAALTALGGNLGQSPAGDSVATNASGAVQGLHAGYLAIRTEMERPVTENPRWATSFFKYLLDRVEMIRVVLPPGTDLNRYFEVMNTRGAQLEPTDIVRAKLMSALSADVAQMHTFARVWDACSQMEGYVQIALTHGDTSLRSEAFGSDWKWVKTPTFERLTEILGGNADESFPLTVGSRDLVTALADYLESRSAPADEAAEAQINRQYQATIQFPFLLLHALTLFEKLERPDPTHRTESGTDDAADADPLAEDPALNDKQLIRRFDAAFARGPGDTTRVPDPDKVRRFAVHLLRVRNLVDAYIVRRHQQGPSTGDDDGTWALHALEISQSGRTKKVAYQNTFDLHGTDKPAPDPDTSTVPEMRTDQRDLVLLQSMLRVTFTSPRSMRWITDVLEMALHHHFPRESCEGGAAPTTVLSAEEVRTYLKNLARERVRKSFLPVAPLGRTGPDDLQTSSTGFDIPRVVYTYLDYLMLDENFRENPQEDDSFAPVSSRDFIFRFRNSVEHFAPQGRDEETDAVVVTEPWMNSLGNLALVTVRQNSKFSNSSPTTKAGSSEAVLAQSPKLWRMAQRTRTAGSWGNEQIEAHHRECVELLLRDLYP
ncbi:DUF262 domain-containing protein [Brachybacterium paraconglomeratum]|uniref:DUF262 domain-containing protein n=1 Tax=Brachybacterium paraconglomeratum TaxID=173362 RepID=UPI00026C6AF0|nr:DUF262 domain-containing protein [Brachybacterium paraconglomeratum]